MNRFLSQAAMNLLAASVLAIFAGCNHMRVLSVDSPNSYSEINQRGEQSTALVTLNSGGTVSARSLHFAPDVVTWMDPWSGEMGSVQTANIKSVQFQSQGSGALEGLGIGLIVGVVGGTVLGLIATATEPANCSFFCGTGTNVVFGIIVVGVPSSVIGGLAGAARGSRSVYAVEPRHDNRPSDLGYGMSLQVPGSMSYGQQIQFPPGQPSASGYFK